MGQGQGILGSVAMKVTYTTEDGTVFDSESAAVKHEKTKAFYNVFNYIEDNCVALEGIPDAYCNNANGESTEDMWLWRFPTIEQIKELNKLISKADETVAGLWGMSSEPEDKIPASIYLLREDYHCDGRYCDMHCLTMLNATDLLADTLKAANWLRDAINDTGAEKV
jgi:hypothetical protein